KKEIFVARQPIFDKDQNIFGYELLFRSGLENFFDQTLDKDFASSKTLLDSLLVFGIDELTGGKKTFMNFTKKVLLSEVALAFPKDSLIIELLETIEPEEEVVEVCRKLKNNGYTLALDDFIYSPRFRPLIELADIIKVDFLLTTGLERMEVMEKSAGENTLFLAEKIENDDEFKEAVKLGYTYFQGFFFCKPVVLSGKDVPSYKLNLMQVLKELNEPVMDITRIEKIMSRDVALSYKLLRFINSASFGIAREVSSIKHALNLLGLMELKKWMSLIVLSQIGSDKPAELITSSIIRAKFCELTAEQTSLKSRKNDLFLMGLFSFIDTFLNRPMDDVLSDLPLADDIKDALRGKENQLSRVLQLIIVYEKGQWDKVAELVSTLKLENSNVLPNYLTAIKWANEFN
ncbi:MAG: HDOD domain-containing protein, partial [bacterium]|nr:HDOD domain-containing protein [bacterium]